MSTLRSERTGNGDFPWDEFDPEWYVGHNYRSMRDDDRQLVQWLRDFLADATDGRRDLRGIDVGPGANLYPALAMLPYCREITLWERGRSNVDWLRQEVADYPQSWDDFWRLLSDLDTYREIEDPRRLLRDRTEVKHRDLFALGTSQWEVGTMFFVAESMTTQPDEFRRAVAQFVRALKPGSPFAMAFMRNSCGYHVGEHHFPAVAVTEIDVKQCLSDLDCHADIESVSTEIVPLRDGYDGMFLAYGSTGGTIH